LISKVIPGSVASRSGSINPGDILLAVNGVYLSSCSLAEAIRLLQSPLEEIVTLRIQKIADTSLIGSGPESSTGRFTGRRNHYGRSDSVPESELGRAGSAHSSTVTSRHKSEPEVDVGEFREAYDRSHPLSEPAGLGRPLAVPVGAEPLSSLSKSGTSGPIGELVPMKGAKSHLVPEKLENHIHTDRSTSSGQDDLRMGSAAATIGVKSRATTATVSSKSNNTLPLQDATSIQADIQSFTSAHDSLDTRSRLISSPEDMSQDDGFSVVRVTLKRKSAECPWGIIICGTDEASNAPVFIDSLNPGDPGAASGLLFPGDRILAINGNALHAGHTLTQAMRMLQRYPDRVVLHVARQQRISEPELGRSPQSLLDGRKRMEPEIDSRILMDEPVQMRMNEKEGLSRKPSLKKVSTMVNVLFQRSFDNNETRVCWALDQAGQCKWCS
uniref:PDZ domain-containing protein n=1 Tax=Echinostoma caproni TaxID=27848 RepID=A0A183B3U8_9TREM